ncbi:hypothetical protein FIBSPDRAFT_698600, partial [Athelia psychrophila]
SLLSIFPSIEAATITSIIQHDFRATELFKLDSRYRDKSDRQVLAFNGTALEVSNRDSVAKEYKTHNSVSVPLMTYFSVLIAAVPAADAAAVGRYFLWYTAHLLKNSVDYEWPAVLSYHTEFFNRRRREMSSSDYTGWNHLDHDLLGEHLLGHRK